MVKRVEWKGFAPLIQLLAASPYPPFSPLFASDRDYSQKVAAQSNNFNAGFNNNNNSNMGGQSRPAPLMQEGFQQQRGVFTLDAVEGTASKPAPASAPAPAPAPSASASTPAAAAGSMYGKVRQQIAKSSENAATDVNALLWGQKEGGATTAAAVATSSSAVESPPHHLAEEDFPPVQREEVVVVKKATATTAAAPAGTEKISKSKKKANRKKEKAAAAAAAAAATTTGSSGSDNNSNETTNVIVTKESVVISPVPESNKPKQAVPAPYVQKAPVKPKKQSLMEVMAEEQKKTNEENAIREMREREEAKERQAKQNAGMWNSAKVANHKPTLREIMELEEREEKLRAQNQQAQLAERSVLMGGGSGGMSMGGGPTTPGWGSFSSPSKTGKSLREIQAEEEREMKNKKNRAPMPAAAAPTESSNAAPVADEDFFWGQKPKTQTVSASEEDFPSLPGAKSKTTKPVIVSNKNTSMAAKVSQKGGNNNTKKSKKKMVKMDL
jgi:hypothetical protein